MHIVKKSKSITFCCSVRKTRKLWRMVKRVCFHNTFLITFRSIFSLKFWQLLMLCVDNSVLQTVQKCSTKSRIPNLLLYLEYSARCSCNTDNLHFRQPRLFLILFAVYGFFDNHLIRLCFLKKKTNFSKKDFVTSITLLNLLKICFSESSPSDLYKPCQNKSSITNIQGNAKSPLFKNSILLSFELWCPHLSMAP